MLEERVLILYLYYQLYVIVIVVTKTVALRRLLTTYRTKNVLVYDGYEGHLKHPVILCLLKYCWYLPHT